MGYKLLPEVGIAAGVWVVCHAWTLGAGVQL